MKIHTMRTLRNSIKASRVKAWGIMPKPRKMSSYPNGSSNSQRIWRSVITFWVNWTFFSFFNTTLEWRFTFFLLFTFQVYIAQREFVQAVDLVLRAQEFCRSHGQESQTVQEASIRLQEKIQHLINVLSGELSTEKSFQGGPRAARNAVQLLCRLGRSTQATDLFLHHRTAIIRSAMK